MDFKIGDVVRLASGGPNMTIKYAGTKLGEPVVFCVWFEAKQVKEHEFPPAVLVPA